MSLDKRIDIELLETLRGMPIIWKDSWSLEYTQLVWNKLSHDYPPIESNQDVLIKVRELTDGFEDGSVSIRIYTPKINSCNDYLPALLWMHGGGFIGGCAKSDDMLCSELALRAKCVVVSVDYRLAPQNPYPKPINDCYRTLTLIAADLGESLNIDTSRIAIGGVSAGGCLAAGVSLLSRDRGGPSICYQLLVIPVLDDRHETNSSHLVVDPRVWNRSLSIEAWSAYLGNIESDVPIYAAPGRADDLSKLPPTFITVEDLSLIHI